jgi:hypothetical protein
MQKFLVDSDSGVKVLGGARFDSSRSAAPEWEAFGGYYMVLPAVEIVCPATKHRRPSMRSPCVA